MRVGGRSMLEGLQPRIVYGIGGGVVSENAVSVFRSEGLIRVYLKEKELTFLFLLSLSLPALSVLVLSMCSLDPLTVSLTGLETLKLRTDLLLHLPYSFLSYALASWNLSLAFSTADPPWRLYHFLFSSCRTFAPSHRSLFPSDREEF